MPDTFELFRLFIHPCGKDILKEWFQILAELTWGEVHWRIYVDEGEHIGWFGFTFIFGLCTKPNSAISSAPWKAGEIKKPFVW